MIIILHFSDIAKGIRAFRQLTVFIVAAADSLPVQGDAGDMARLIISIPRDIPLLVRKTGGTVLFIVGGMASAP